MLIIFLPGILVNAQQCLSRSHSITTFSVTTLNKTARATDDAINRQPDIISIRRDTFNPVINLKDGIAYWAPGFTMPGLDTVVQTE